MTPLMRNLAIAAIMVVGIGGIVYLQKQNAAPVAGTAATSTSAVLADVAAHNTRESCWTIINDGIYDLTSWIPQHPGGEQAILVLCGTDGSARFNAKHGGAAQQEAILAGFRIGDAGTAAGAVTAPAAAPATDDNDGSGRNRRGRDNDDD